MHAKTILQLQPPNALRVYAEAAAYMFFHGGCLKDCFRLHTGSGKYYSVRRRRRANGFNSSGDDRDSLPLSLALDMSMRNRRSREPSEGA